MVLKDHATSSGPKEDDDMRKWQYIADALRIKGSPEKVINAAKEIDAALVRLGLGNAGFEYGPYKEGNSHKSESWADISDMVYDVGNCSACCDCEQQCENCKLGGGGHCTPRSKHADDYFKVITDYVSKKMRS